MSDIQFISIVAGLLIFAITMVRRLFHQKPSDYCQRIFDEHRERIEKAEKRLDGHDRDTSEHKAGIAVLIQGNENIKKSLDIQQKIVENISNRIADILVLKMKEN